MMKVIWLPSRGKLISKTSGSVSYNKAKVNTNNIDRSVIHTMSKNNTHQKYFKNTFINSISIKCYVDMGSSGTLIRDKRMPIQLG